MSIIQYLEGQEHSDILNHLEITTLPKGYKVIIEIESRFNSEKYGARFNEQCKLLSHDTNELILKGNTTWLCSEIKKHGLDLIYIK
jgi:hypothetical protein